MDAGALLAVIALILVVVSFFRQDYPLVAVAVLLLAVAVLVGVSPLEVD